uniref:Uncharacterized protein n=1 Tax=Acrobeloides nanus TaxID=290746 RepID=A0A914DE63_9BILA
MSTNKNKTETTIEDIRQRLKNLTERRTKDLSHSHTNTQTQKTSETLENHRTGFTEPKEIKKPKLDLRLPFSSSADGHANIAIKSSLPSPKKDFRTPSVSQVPGTAEV